MIWMFMDNGKGPVKLFGQYKPSMLMCQGHF